MKYLDTQVVFREIPDEVTLAINITNCKFHCKGCHSPELWKDIGTPLTNDEVDNLIHNNPGITCVCFMGGEPSEVWPMCDYIHIKHQDLKVGWYTGYEWIDLYNLGLSDTMNKFDYIKLGPYKEEFGPLDKPGTNQVMFKRSLYGSMDNITSKFWKENP